MNKIQMVRHHNQSVRIMNANLKDVRAFAKIVEKFPTKAGMRRIIEKLDRLIFIEEED